MNRIPKIMSVIIRNLVYYSQCDWSLSRYHLMVSGRGILYDRLTHTPPHPHTFLACLIPVWLNIILHPLSTMPWFWPVMGWVWKAKAPLTERCRFESLTLPAGKSGRENPFLSILPLYKQNPMNNYFISCVYIVHLILLQTCNNPCLSQQFWIKEFAEDLETRNSF